MSVRGNNQEESHVLVLESKVGKQTESKVGKQTIILDAATYSIGRDRKNAIVIDDRAISRQHSILLRLPISKGGYRYRLIDGSATGKPSANGVKVNGQRCKSSELNSGDLILLADKVKIRYQVLPISSTPYIRYLNLSQVNFQSIKSQSGNFKETELIMGYPSLHSESLNGEEDLPTQLLVDGEGWQLFD